MPDKDPTTKNSSSQVNLFPDGCFAPELIPDKEIAGIISEAVKRNVDRNNEKKKIRPIDFLLSFITSNHPLVGTVITPSLEEGTTLRDVVTVIKTYYSDKSKGMQFSGTKEEFSINSQKILTAFEDYLSSGISDRSEIPLQFLCCILSYLDSDVFEKIYILNWEHAKGIISTQIKALSVPLQPLFDPESRKLRSEEFSESAWIVMENTRKHAEILGYDRIMPPHLFLALLEETEGITEQLVRLQASPEVGPVKIIKIVSDAFRLSSQKKGIVELKKEGYSDQMIELLNHAQKIAKMRGSDYIEEVNLLTALLDDLPPRLRSVLCASPLNLNVEKFRQELDQQLLIRPHEVREEVAFRLPQNILPSEDLTYLSRIGNIKSRQFEETKKDENGTKEKKGYFDSIQKGLFRRKNNHILITGLKGIGKTSLVFELALRSARGDIPFLKKKRFLWIDCSNILLNESKQKFEAIISFVASRTDLILCLDDLGTLLRAESGGNNKIILKNALKEGTIHLIGILSDWDYKDLLATDHELLEYFTLVSMEEPSNVLTLEMVKSRASDLEKEYGLSIQEKAIERCIALSSEYIMNERFPTKALKILRNACEDLYYRKNQKNESVSEITTNDVINVISDITQIPVETLSGIGNKNDYEREFSREIIGQQEAVRAVAKELQKIKAGSGGPGQPASVMLFAGLTGTGKTELAKTIAQLYSASKKLMTYPMGNYTEPHTVSNIIGVPPGYVGHEHGGRLINELNSDPYCVFLLDEAEKAHPDIWKPFLNLFDEGWVEDLRSTKAFGDKAIFILTTNAGAEIIATMCKQGRSMDEITMKVREELLNVKNNRTQQPVFTPEFIARIKKIIIFNPLDQEAMEGICRKMFERMKVRYRKKKEKGIVIPDALIDYIARDSHEKDLASGHKEGGRIVSKLLDEFVVEPIDNAVAQNEEVFRSCSVIELSFIDTFKEETLPLHHTPGTQIKPKVSVIFRSDPPAPAEDIIRKVTELLRAEAERIESAHYSTLEVLKNCAALIRMTKNPAEITLLSPSDQKISTVLELILNAEHEVTQSGEGAVFHPLIINQLIGAIESTLGASQ